MQIYSTHQKNETKCARVDYQVEEDDDLYRNKSELVEQYHGLQVTVSLELISFIRAFDEGDLQAAIDSLARGHCTGKARPTAIVCLQPMGHKDMYSRTVIVSEKSKGQG